MGQIEDLRLFAKVVENRSISKAADKLHIAKSAVSRRLHLLEERYGTRLVDRSPGVWEITATGRELYQRAARVVSEVDEIEGDFTETAQIIAGPLVVSVPHDYGITQLNPALIGFKARFPEIQLMIDFDDRTVDLARENYDFAIRITSHLTDGVVASVIGTTRHKLCASPTYLSAKGTPESLPDLHNHSLLNFGTTRRASWDFVNQNGKRVTIGFQPSLNSNSGEFLLKAAVGGLGLVRLPDFILAPSIASGDLVSILPNLTVPDWSIYLAHAEHRRFNRRMRLFSEEMKNACSSGENSPFGNS